MIQDSVYSLSFLILHMFPNTFVWRERLERFSTPAAAANTGSASATPGKEAW